MLYEVLYLWYNSQTYTAAFTRPRHQRPISSTTTGQHREGSLTQWRYIDRDLFLIRTDKYRQETFQQRYIYYKQLVCQLTCHNNTPKCTNTHIQICSRNKARSVPYFPSSSTNKATSGCYFPSSSLNSQSLTRMINVVLHTLPRQTWFADVLLKNKQQKKFRTHV